MSEERGRGVHASTAPGSVVATRYLVERELGRGGMATVLEVKDLRTDRKLALKVLRPEIAAHAEAVERFRREGEFLSSLRHPALITVEAIGTLPDGRLYLAMELLRGETLGERIRRGKLSPIEISPILAGAAVGLEAAHRAGVVHRDLKPDNIFLASTSVGAPMQVKLLDFGISKIDGRASLTRTGQVLGTPRYMAPEQLRGESDLDARVDVYALGVILYEALAGIPAFPSQHPSDLILAILGGHTTPLRAVRPDLSAELEAVVARAMSKTREARFASAIELADAWFEVVHRNDGPKAVRTGVATSVLGSVADSVRPPSPYGPDDLRPATFREFEMRSPPLPAEAPGRPLADLVADDAMKSPDATAPAHVPGARSVVATPTAKPLEARAPASTSEARPRAAALAMNVTDLAPIAAALPGSSGEIPLAGVGDRGDETTRTVNHPSDPPVVPTRASRAPLVLLAVGVVALVAFGLAAFVSHRRDPSAAALGAAMPVVRMPVLALDASALATPHDAGALVLVDASVGASPVVDAGAALASEGRDRDRDDAREGTEPDRHARPDTNLGDPWTDTAPTTETTTTTSTPETTSETPADGRSLLADAREALASGDARRCIELATEAIAAGVDPSVYRVRGDCYRALGDSAHALRSYQRFCSLAPNSGQVDAVRSAAEALGGTCP